MTEQSSYELAERIHRLEAEGLQTSKKWYEFEHATGDDLAQLKSISDESLQLLEQLSHQLEHQLQADLSGEAHDKTQYAYHLTKELIQSRQATEELLGVVLSNPTLQFQEYMRALALKEHAAEEQASKLKTTLATIH